jgi:hypothetical protein
VDDVLEIKELLSLPSTQMCFQGRLNRSSDLPSTSEITKIIKGKEAIEEFIGHVGVE